MLGAILVRVPFALYFFSLLDFSDCATFEVALGSLLPTFEQELKTVQHLAMSTLSIGDKILENQKIAEVLAEKQPVTNDKVAESTLQRAMTLLRDRKEHLRGNGCTEDDIGEFVVNKWAALRLQKLPFTFVRELSPELREVRANAMSQARSAASKIERSCITRTEENLKTLGNKAPEPNFNPDAPGKHGREDEPPVLMRVPNPDLGPLGKLGYTQLPSGDETADEALIRQGLAFPAEEEQEENAEAKAQREREELVEDLMLQMRSTSNYELRCEIRDQIREYVILQQG